MKSWWAKISQSGLMAFLLYSILIIVCNKILLIIFRVLSKTISTLIISPLPLLNNLGKESFDGSEEGTTMSRRLVNSYPYFDHLATECRL